jgi:hypothetical protein
VVADGLLENVGQVGGRVGGDNQGALSGVGVPHGVAQAILVLPTPPLPEKKMN